MYISKENAITMLHTAIDILRAQPNHGIYYTKIDISRCPGTNVPAHEVDSISQKMVMVRCSALARHEQEVKEGKWTKRDID